MIILDAIFVSVCNILMSMNYKEKTKEELIIELQEFQQENNFLKSSLDTANTEVSRLTDKVFDFRWMLEHAGDAAIYRGNYRTMNTGVLMLSRF
jgi:hypothetical protein